MQTLEVYNDMIYGTTPVYTSEELSDALGRWDQLVVQVVATQAEKTGFSEPTLDVALEESNNGQDWSARAAALTDETLSETATTSLKLADAGTRPFQAYVRIKLNLGASDESANIKVYATGRNGR